VYEDSALIVVNKPAGLVVHPGAGHRTGTLVNGLLALAGFGRPPSDPGDPQGRLRPGIVQRIDRDTSGLLVVAKTEAARENLKAQLAAHTVRRHYLAITIGVPETRRIETLHGRHPTNRLRFSTRVSRGKQAITNVAVRQVLSGRAALVECRLETGRTHQIRVHLAEISRTPILADSLYGGVPGQGELAAIASRLGRQALHAASLGFRHPDTNAEVEFEASLPEDLQLALDAIALFDNR
jgi:23S rRNA pseudouridine1911/1915/1917 synthase